MKAVIIEDEKPAARRLERMLSAFSEIQLLATLHSVEEAVAWFQTHPAPEVVFSDIVLGDGLSFDIFEAVPVKSFIIYTTAFDQYTLKAFKLNSIDYLLKPIDEEELTKAIDKCKLFLPSEEQVSAQELKTLIKTEKPLLSRILVKIGYHLKVLKTEEITCFYSENKIVYAQTAERTFPTDFTLDELEQNLNPKLFFRVNRQFIIHSEFITSIHTSPYYKVELSAQPEQEITVSRERVKDFKEWLVK